jgi:hypothetical protein
VVSGPEGGPFTVSATHTYGSTGRFNITTKINDVAGSANSATCNTLVYAFQPGAVAFVISDNSTANGAQTNFWVVPSNGLPTSLKDWWQKIAPTCGIDWGTITGNTSPTARRPLPDYMGVIVINALRDSTSRSTGVTGHIVVVRTDTRHPSRGTVEAQVC